MKVIHWRIKVTYNFEKKVNQKVNLYDVHRYFNGGIFDKPIQKYFKMSADFFCLFVCVEVKWPCQQWSHVKRGQFTKPHFY